jgi:Glycosyltransferase sugar-binding region containing DXD motif
MNQKQIAQFLWIGPRLSNIEKLCLSSFLRVGYVVHLYAYDDIIGVPSGVIMQEAGTILPRKEVFQYKVGFACGSYAGFSDRFRYHLLEKKGGWYFDMDFVAVRLRELPNDLKFASTWEGKWRECASNCAIWCLPGDPRMVRLREECDVLCSQPEAIRFGDGGPFLVQRIVRELDLQKNVAPYWEFCPFPWRMIERTAFCTSREWLIDRARHGKHRLRELVSSSFRAGYLRSRTRAVHLHNEIWRAKGMSKDARYHPWSFVGHHERVCGIT